MCQISGTLLSNTPSNTNSRSEDITTKPSIAFLQLIKLDLTTDSNLLNLINSYNNTVFIDSLYEMGCNLWASLLSKLGGNFFKISSILDLITSSGDYPPPPAVLGNKDRIVPVIKLVSKIALLISALGCNPKTSVGSLRAMLLIASL